MRTEVPTFDAMPQMMANILEKLETLEQKFDALQSNSSSETSLITSDLNVKSAFPPFISSIL